ncbi:MAG TPA: hypothetical protein VLW44_11010 [Streptosporangiaceae bacterium]|nr:hypothetical protein [Streptosporangiaceae bacterium]
MVVTAGYVTPRWENSLAARMTWPHRPASRHRLATPGSPNRGYLIWYRQSPARTDPGPAAACPGRDSRERARSRSLLSVIFQQEDE